MCLNLGMIGTIWGFILMLAGFVNVDVSDIKSVQELLTSMSGGMSIALYTTLTGLVCSQILKVQFFNLENAVTYCDNFPEGDSQDVVEEQDE
jgi:biopolymer transport protein ExbB/TolQ